MFLLWCLWPCVDWACRDTHAKTPQILKDLVCLWRATINFYIRYHRQMYLPSIPGVNYIVPCLTNIRQTGGCLLMNKFEALFTQVLKVFTESLRFIKLPLTLFRYVHVRKCRGYNA